MPGKDFGQPANERTARIAYVSFKDRTVSKEAAKLNNAEDY